MKKSFFILFLFVLPFAVIAQKSFEHNYYSFEYKFLPENSNYKEIFKLLSVNNEKNINSLKLKIFFRPSIKNTGNSKEIIYSEPKIKGDIYFRDFKLDSLLTPDIINVYVTNKHVNVLNADENKFTFHFPGIIRINNIDNIEDYNFRVEFDISDQKLGCFIRISEKINLYYSYYTLLSKLKNKFLTNDESGISVLSDYDVVHRIDYNVGKERIIDFLSLKENDPENFIPLYNKTKRLERRKQTLSLQYIDKDLSNLKDKRIFENNLVHISIKFLKEKNNYQPYLSTSFEQTAGVIHDEISKKFYKKVCKKLDSNVPENIPVSERIFKGFLRESEKYNDNEQFTSSFIMLKNAGVWAEINGIDKFDDLKPYVNKAIDGLLSSYARIAEAAVKNGNNRMAEIYLKKAETFYESKIKEFPNANTGSFEKFQTHLLNITEFKIKNNSYRAAINLLLPYKEMKLSNDNLKQRFNEIKTKAYNGIYRQYFNMVSSSFNSGNVDETYKRLMDLYNFKKVNPDFITNTKHLKEKINRIVYGLILEYLQQGEMLWDKGNYQEAMNNYGMAEKLQNTFLDYKIERLEKLLNQTAIPVVLGMIDKAELEIWANDIDKANDLYDEANETVLKYNLGEVDTVEFKLSQLKNKLESRNCVVASNRLENNLVVIKNRINSGKWNEAYKRFVESRKILKQNNDCDIDSSKFVELKSKFNDVFEYLRKYNETENVLLTEGYNVVWKSFAELSYEYNKKGFDKLGIPKPELYALLKSQKNPEKVKQVVDYYLSKGYTKSALRFLGLLHEMNVYDKEVKQLLTETGIQMARKDELINDFKEISQYKDKWYKPLINSYLKTVN